uniref:Uncharacterized protein n=2 Tax=Noccaea caerulescens TaxID=107243 RepID=A0A1J3JTV3_NOCCA
MASASSSAARLLFRDGKSAASLLLRARTANLTETVHHNTGPAIRSLLRFSQTPASQYPVFSDTFSVVQYGFRAGFNRQETVSERRGEMEAGHGKGVVDNESWDSEEETDFDDEDLDDIIHEDEEFDDSDEDDDDEEEEEQDKFTR